jgi:hypothetical protein
MRNIYFVVRKGMELRGMGIATDASGHLDLGVFEFGNNVVSQSFRIESKIVVVGINSSFILTSNLIWLVVFDVDPID